MIESVKIAFLFRERESEKERRYTMGNETSIMEPPSQVDDDVMNHQENRNQRRNIRNGRMPLTCQDGSSSHQQVSTLGLDLNAGKTMTYVPQQFPSSTSSLQQQKPRRSFSSTSSTSSHSTKSSSNTSNKRALLVSSGDILEPPTIKTNSSSFQQPKQTKQSNFESEKARVVRQVDFVNMNVNQASHSQQVKMNDKQQNNNSRGRRLLQKVFKGGKKKEKYQNLSNNIPNMNNNESIIDMTNVAAGSSGFAKPIDYQNLNGVEDDEHDDEYGYHYYEDNDLDRSVLPSDRLQQKYDLHDNGRLPTILDVSYQSSTMNVSMDHEGENNQVNMASLLDDQNNDDEWDEDNDVINIEPQLEEEIETCDTPVNSVVTEEAYDLKSRFSSCTKSHAHNGSNEKEVEKLGALNEADDDLDVNESDYTAHLNSFLDKVHASYDADGEQVGDIQTPLVRLGDLFGDMTLNNSRYQHLDSSRDEEERVDKSVQGNDVRNVTISSADEEYDPRLQALDILHETLEDGEDSPSRLLENCMDQTDFQADSRDDDNEIASTPSIRSDDLSNADRESFYVPEDFTTNIAEASQNPQSAASSNTNKIIRENSPMPQVTEILKAPTSPTTTNLLPQINDENEEHTLNSKNHHESYKNENGQEEVDKIDRAFQEVESNRVDTHVQPITMTSQDVPTRTNDDVRHVKEEIAKENPMNVTEIAVDNVQELVKKVKGAKGVTDSQIGTIINILLPNQLHHEKGPVTYSDASTIAQPSLTYGKKDAFTKEAMLNANFLFAGGPCCTQRESEPTTKIDKQRLSLTNIEEVSKIVKIHQGSQFDPMKLLQNAKLELEQCKKIQQSRDSGKHFKLGALQIENKVEIKLPEQKPILSLEGKRNQTIENASHQAASGEEKKEHLEESVEENVEQSNDQRETTTTEANCTPKKNTHQSLINQLSDSPDTRDSLDDILEGISPSELRKRYSAITPMKSFSPFVRFKKAMRLFENDNGRTDSHQKSSVEEKAFQNDLSELASNDELKVNEVQTKPTETSQQKWEILPENKKINSKEVLAKSSRKSPPKRNASSEKEDFVYHRDSPMKKVDDTDDLPKAPHTLKLIKTLSYKSQSSDTNDEISNKQIEELEEKIYENIRAVKEAVSNDNSEEDPVELLDTEAISRADCFRGDGDAGYKNYKELDSALNEDEIETSCDSPYDENDELSIEITPEKSIKTPVSEIESSYGSNDSLNTSPFSTESEDVFATLLKNATAASPDVSLSSTSSSLSSPSVSKPQPEMLKSALKKKRSFDSIGSQQPHNVRWSLANLDGQVDNKDKSMANTSVNESIMANKIQSDENHNLSVYDETLSTTSKEMNPENNSHPVVMETHDDNEFVSDQASPKLQRGILFSPGEESSRVSVTPPPLSKSVRAAVNPREQQIHRMNMMGENDKENIHSNVSYPSPSTSSIGDGLCSYSPLEMSKNGNSLNHHSPSNIVKPQSLCLSPLQRTPMQARKWRTLAAQAEEKKKSNKKIKRKSGSGLGRTPLGKLRNRRSISTCE